MSASSRNKLGAMIHNIGYPDLVLSDEQLGAEIQGVSSRRSSGAGAAEGA